MVIDFTAFRYIVDALGGIEIDVIKDLYDRDWPARRGWRGTSCSCPQAMPASIENHLATLRVAGVEVQDMEIRRPDLEDVFLQVMSGTSASNIAWSSVKLRSVIKITWFFMSACLNGV